MTKTLPIHKTKPKSSRPRVYKKYQKLEELGRGGYGTVFRCLDSSKKRYVAVKEILCAGPDGFKSKDPDYEGISTTTLREISILKSVRHPNIVRLIETINEGDKVHLVFEHLDWDLKGYLFRPQHENLDKIRFKEIIFCVLNALNHLHSNRFVHRDIKPENILVDHENNVKLADFGLTRPYTVPSGGMTHEVITLYYRAPEVLLNAERYSSAVDIWSVGCLFAELYNNNRLFPGQSEMDMLFRICKVRGTPSRNHCPGIYNLENFHKGIPKWKPYNLSDICPSMDADELKLLDGMLQMDPSKRISAKRALQSPIFDEFLKKSHL